MYNVFQPPYRSCFGKTKMSVHGKSFLNFMFRISSTEKVSGRRISGSILELIAPNMFQEAGKELKYILVLLLRKKKVGGGNLNFNGKFLSSFKSKTGI